MPPEQNTLPMQPLPKRKRRRTNNENSSSKRQKKNAATRYPKNAFGVTQYRPILPKGVLRENGSSNLTMPSTYPPVTRVFYEWGVPSLVVPQKQYCPNVFVIPGVQSNFFSNVQPYNTSFASPIPSPVVYFSGNYDHQKTEQNVFLPTDELPQNEQANRGEKSCFESQSKELDLTCEKSGRGLIDCDCTKCVAARRSSWILEALVDRLERGDNNPGPVDFVCKVTGRDILECDCAKCASVGGPSCILNGQVNRLDEAKKNDLGQHDFICENSGREIFICDCSKCSSARSSSRLLDELRKATMVSSTEDPSSLTPQVPVEDVPSFEITSVNDVSGAGQEYNVTISENVVSSHQSAVESSVNQRGTVGTVPCYEVPSVNDMSGSGYGFKVATNGIVVSGHQYESSVSY